VDIRSALTHVLDQIEKEKGIKREEILRMIEHALVSAYKKHAGEGIQVVAHVEANGEIIAHVVKKVVQTPADRLTEVGILEARKIDPTVQLGGEVKFPIDAEEFGRIAAQTAKQVLTQKIRETERESVFEEYKPKIGTLVNGTVHRFANRNVIVDLGRAEGIIPMREQVKRERWSIGERIRGLVLKVEKTPRGPEILLSRSSEDFVKCLFEQEVPEIYEKTVQVISVVREAGQRSKVVVKSNNPKIDPIGACVGVKGSRVRPIINELQGERIDLVAFSEDPATFISASLAPAKPISVKIINPEKKLAEVLVADDILSLAIGKNGQNVRLANKLTGWNIEIKTEAQKKQAAQANITQVKELLIQLEGVGPRIADVLVRGGIDSLEKIAHGKVEDLTVFSGIGEKLAEKMIESAKKQLENPVPVGVIAEPAPAKEVVGEKLTGEAPVETPPEEPAGTKKPGSSE